jgi:hypothetical protein
MCYYPELMMLKNGADKRAMQPERLKNLVESGDYRPRPALIAEAMLRRRGVRELLADEVLPLNPTGRSRPAQAAGHRAA